MSLSMTLGGSMPSTLPSLTVGTLEVTGAATFAATVTATGQFLAGNGSAAAPSYSFVNDPDSGFYAHAANIVGLSLGGTARYVFASTQIVPLATGVIEIGASANRFPVIYLGGNTPAASAPMLDCSQTWNDAGQIFIGAKVSITNTNSAPGSYAFATYGGAAGTTFAFGIEPAGYVVSAAGVQAPEWRFPSTVRITGPYDGIVVLCNNASDNFDRLCLGGVTASFPAVQRSGTKVAFVLADNSAYCPIQVDDIYYRTTKILGAQGAAVADATGAGDVVAQLNTLLARLRAHGLIST